MSAIATNATLASEVAPTAHTGSEGVLVLGLDAGFKHFGWGVVRLLPEGGERVEALGSILTEPSKRRGLVRDDDRRRAAEIASSNLRSDSAIPRPSVTKSSPTVTTTLPKRPVMKTSSGRRSCSPA